MRATSLTTIELNEQTQPTLDITQDYDSDGQPSKRVQVARKDQCLYVDEVPSCDPVEQTDTSRYVRSTVLGGALIEDLGAGEVSIYASGQRIAKATSNTVTFEQHNPMTGSWVTSNGHSDYRTTNRQERDPMGAEIPLSSPWGSGGTSYVKSKFGELLFIEGGDPFDYSSGMEIDGMPVSAAEFARRTGNGSVGAGLSANGKQSLSHPEEPRLISRAWR